MQNANLADETAKLRAAQAQIRAAGPERSSLRLSTAEERNQRLKRELQQLQARPITTCSSRPIASS